MTSTPKLKYVLMIALVAVAAVIVLVCVIMFASQPSASVPSSTSQQESHSQEWRQIDEISGYQGLLDFPITQISLYGFSDHPYDGVTFSDGDLIARWNDYLNALELQEYARYFQEDLLQIDGTPLPTATITTETGEYTLIFCQGQNYFDRSSGEETLEYQEWEDGNYRLQYDGWYYSLSDPEGFPFEETYNLAVERHGLDDPG